MKTQICLISQQAAANLLPALDDSIKPDRIIMVVTGKMQRQAANLESVLKQVSIKVETFRLSNEQDFRQTEQELIDLATQIEDDDVALNITGGTKLISIAAQSVADASGWGMFYVDADSDQIIWLGRDQKPTQALQKRLKLRHYLMSYGFKLTGEHQRQQASQAQSELTQTLVQQAGSLENSITQLNALAQEAEKNKKLAIPLDDRRYLDNASLDVLLRYFERAGALRRDGNTIRFIDDEARSFVKGGWLELHAIHAVNLVHKELNIQDKAIGLEIADTATDTRNELDIAFMARNRLFIIECKTARIDKVEFRGDKAIAPKANDALFKLAENCRRIGGLGARGLLLSYRRLGPAELRLASSLGIEVVHGNEIARLPEKLKAWVKPQP